MAAVSALVPSASAEMTPAVDKVGVVLTPGAPGAWDAAMVESPSVVRDGGRWVMAYTGYGGEPMRGGVGLAYSRDGVEWTRGGQILEDATGPVLYRDGSRWVLYYIELTATGYEQGRKSIHHATADTLTGPWVRHGEVIGPDGEGWDAEAVWHVSVVRRGADWFCFFNATGEDGRERIGYATGPSLVGPWDVQAEPLLEPDRAELIVGDPAVRRERGGWVMTYYATHGGQASDFEAVTTDAEFPQGWEPRGRVLAPSETYDGKYAHKPWVIRNRGVLLHYYTAVSEDDQRQIALAVR